MSEPEQRRPSTPSRSAPSLAETVAATGVLARSPWLLLAGFVAVHAWLVSRALAHSSAIFGDVGLYEWWIWNGQANGVWPVLDTEWVYPAGALLPLVVAGLGPWPYAAGFVGLVILLNALALAYLWDHRPFGTYGGWFWLAFLALLGPISLGRIDGIVAPLILVAATAGLRHPRTAAAIATAGAWIKIAPAAVFLTVLTFTRRRVPVLAVGAAVSAAVVVTAMALGSGTRVFSVFGEQGKRALQAESVLATPFSLARLWNGGTGTAAPVYNEEIYTYEFLSPAADAVARALDLVLPLAVVALLALGWWAWRRNPRQVQAVFLLTTQAVLVALVVFNKVGSPQFIAWLGPVVAVGLSAGRHLRLPWEIPALGLLAAAALTQLVYPVDYGGFILAEPTMVVVAALRNLLVVAVLVAVVVELVGIARHRRGRRGAGRVEGAAPRPLPAEEPAEQSAVPEGAAS
ncbi:uncharacterized protein DUF2029 [Salana multivorans]|uniref:Uncharacterized protein DUF2029 n=1 Tax=Salana multivorans TaxID=120377 RepID=A0A3N2DCI4_9MICO|nr:glycosyltransferase 87 family protein [Salana multivorans]ROR97505.1 uncharacterized protein DUF2029 [Salana multivorans]